MVAMTYNLKKQMRFVVKKPSILTQVVTIEQGKVMAFLKTIIFNFKTCFF